MTDHNNTGATARLWKIDPRPFRNHGLIHISNGEYIVAMAFGQTATCETEAEANAKLIVEAVNAYEPLKARLVEAQDGSVQLQRHRDHWRGYAYGRRDRPQDFLDGNMVEADRPPTMVERALAAEARVAVLEKALEFYANPEIYKPHPHGAAFDRRDESYIARTALAAKQDTPQ